MFQHVVVDSHNREFVLLRRQHRFQPLKLLVIQTAKLVALAIEHRGIEGNQADAGNGIAGVVKPIRMTVTVVGIVVGEIDQANRRLGSLWSANIVVTRNDVDRKWKGCQAV